MKRIFDLIFGGTGFFLLSPFLFCIAILIKLDDGGPVFFYQDRIGRYGKRFRMIKFRTMVVNAQSLGGLITVGRDPRITRIGYWLRKFKIDEFPQLYNVLNGTMSLVGPRPEVEKYVAMYTADQKKVLDLMPGITDPASIKYRDESELLASASDPEKEYIDIVMPDKIKINLAYAEKATVLTDFLFVLKTLKKLVS